MTSQGKNTERIRRKFFRPALSWPNNGTNLVTSWPGNFILQNATNVIGPYFDVSNATSPYSLDVNQFPRQFFRLRD